MQFDIYRDKSSGDVVFSGRVTYREMQELVLDHIDQAVVSSPATTAHDALQTLEIIFRRHAETAETKKSPASG